MAREARRLDALDLRVCVVVPVPPSDTPARGDVQRVLRQLLGGPVAGLADDGQRVLDDRCSRVARGLAAACVRAWSLEDGASSRLAAP